MPEQHPARDGPPRVELATEAGIRLAAVCGDVDLDGCDEVERSLAPAREGGGPLLLDLTGVRFMDSSGLHLVLRLWGGLAREGRELAIVCPTGEVRRLFELTQVDRRLGLHPTRAAAIAALGGSAR